MDDQICARILDGLGWLLLIGRLALDLDFVLKGVRLAVASELDSLISEQLHAHNISKGVVFVVDDSSSQIDLILIVGDLLVCFTESKVLHFDFRI